MGELALVKFFFSNESMVYIFFLTTTAYIYLQEPMPSLEYRKELEQILKKS